PARAMSSKWSATAPLRRLKACRNNKFAPRTIFGRTTYISANYEPVCSKCGADALVRVGGDSILFDSFVGIFRFLLASQGRLLIARHFSGGLAEPKDDSRDWPRARRGGGR